MPNFNKNEFGQIIYVNLGEDVSTNTSLAMYLQPKLGTQKEVVPTLGTANVDVDDETYLANEYLKYTIAEGDLDYSGLWRVKGKAILSSTNVVISDYKTFTVLD